VDGLWQKLEMFDEYPIVGFLSIGGIVFGIYWILVRLIGG